MAGDEGIPDVNAPGGSTSSLAGIIGSGDGGKMTKGLGKFADAIDRAERGLEGFSRASNMASDNWAHLLTGINDFRVGIQALEQSLGGADGIIKQNSRLGRALNKVLTPLKLVGEAFGGYIQAQRIMGEVLGATDALSVGVRQTYAEFFELTNLFGGTYAEAQKLAVAFADVQAAAGDAESGFLSRKELLDSAKAMAQYNIEVDRGFESVTAAGEGMNMFSASILQSGAMGMSATEHMNLLSFAIMKTGLNSNEAFKQLAGFEIAAEATGLSVDTVAKGLQQAVSNFQQLGLSADFARPLMIGFADSLQEVGLGVENAVGLSQALAKSLGGLGEDYGMAALVSQLGGLSYGQGGGALSAGIGIQAAMIEADSSGDYEALGMELAGAMRTTLESIGGGEIVTVGEANDDPSKAAAFYTQQQMLSNNFGMSQTEATRTLEMLSALDTATQSGDEETARKLREQIADQKSGRNDTMNLMRKQNVYSAGIFAQAQMQTRMQAMSMRNGPGGEQLAQMMAEADEISAIYSQSVTAGLTQSAVNEASSELNAAYQGTTEGSSLRGVNAGANPRGTVTESVSDGVMAAMAAAMAEMPTRGNNAEDAALIVEAINNLGRAAPPVAGGTPGSPIGTGTGPSGVGGR
jgi:hypothetical protein